MPPVNRSETFASYGSREKDILERVIRQLHGTFTVVSWRVAGYLLYLFPTLSLSPFAMYVAFLRSDSYGPFDCLQGLGAFGTGSPLPPSPLSFASPCRLSRVHRGNATRCCRVACSFMSFHLSVAPSS